MKRWNKGRKRLFFSPDHMEDQGIHGATPKQRLDPLITAVGQPTSHALLCIKHGKADELEGGEDQVLLNSSNCTSPMRRG